jgi:hypothetical protein
MVDDLIRDRDGDVVDGGEERNYWFWMLGVLGFRVRELVGVRPPKLGKVYRKVRINLRV